jgi:hypothetical protein
MYTDLVRFIEKKIEKVMERANQLPSNGQYIKYDECTGNNKAVIESISGDMFDLMCREQTGTIPGPSPEAFGYGENSEEPMSDWLRWEADDTMHTKVFEAVTEQYVSAKRNDVGSALNDFPMRRGSFTAPLIMSTASFVNEKLPKIIEQRDLKFIVINSPLSGVDSLEEGTLPNHDGAAPNNEQSASKDHVSSKREQLLEENVADIPVECKSLESDQKVLDEDHVGPTSTAYGSKLLASEPASKIRVTHVPFSDDDIEVLVLLPDGSVLPGILAAPDNFAYVYGLDYPYDKQDGDEVATKPETTELATAEAGKSYGLDDHSGDEDEENDGGVEDHEVAGIEDGDMPDSESDSWETIDDQDESVRPDLSDSNTEIDDSKLVHDDAAKPETDQDSSPMSAQSRDQSSPDTITTMSTLTSSQDPIDAEWTVLSQVKVPSLASSFILEDITETAAAEVDASSPPQIDAISQAPFSGSPDNSLFPSPQQRPKSPNPRSLRSHSASPLQEQTYYCTRHPTQKRSRSLDSAPTQSLGPTVRKRPGDENLGDKDSPARKVRRNDR